MWYYLAQVKFFGWVLVIWIWLVLDWCLTRCNWNIESSYRVKQDMSTTCVKQSGFIPPDLPALNPPLGWDFHRRDVWLLTWHSASMWCRDEPLCCTVCLVWPDRAIKPFSSNGLLLQGPSVPLSVFNTLTWIYYWWVLMPCQRSSLIY